MFKDCCSGQAEARVSDAGALITSEQEMMLKSFQEKSGLPNQLLLDVILRLTADERKHQDYRRAYPMFFESQKNGE